MRKFWKDSKVVEAVRWYPGDQFIGPMRWDYRAAVKKPYYLLSGRRVYVSDGDWIVYDAGHYYPVKPAVFEQNFVDTWNWAEHESGEESEND